MSKEEDFYKKFEKTLKENQNLPGDYLFKFILEPDNFKISKLKQIFDLARPIYSSKMSKNNKYTSITVKIYALDAGQVVKYYKEASKIEGIMLL